MDGLSAGDGIERIEATLSAYGKSTEALRDALKQGDGEAVSRSLRERGEWIAAYAEVSEGMRRRGTFPDAAFRARVQWHHIRIDALEDEVFRLVKALQEEVERDLGQIRKGQKSRGAYTAFRNETSLIIDGRG